MAEKEKAGNENSAPTRQLTWSTSLSAKEITLMDGIQTADLVNMQIILRDRKFNPNFYANKQGVTPLMLAVAKDRKQCIDLLLKHPSTDLSVCNANGDNVACIAAYYGHLEVLKLLYDQGAPFTSKSGSKTDLLYSAAKRNNLEIVKFLISCGIDYDTPKSSSLLSPLGICAYEGHGQLVEYLGEKGANLTRKSAQKMSPLYLAARKNKLSIVEHLLSYPSVVDDLNKTLENNALIYATKNGLIELATLLLDNGADSKIRATGENLPVMIAIKKNNEKMVKLLAGHMSNVDIDIGSENTTPFYYAVLNNQLNIAQILLENGASHYWRNKHMEQLYDLVEEKNIEAVEFMKRNKIWKSGITPEPDNNIRPESEKPPPKKGKERKVKRSKMIVKIDPMLSLQEIEEKKNENNKKILNLDTEPKRKKREIERRSKLGNNKSDKNKSGDKNRSGDNNIGVINERTEEEDNGREEDVEVREGSKREVNKGERVEETTVNTEKAEKKDNKKEEVPRVPTISREESELTFRAATSEENAQDKERRATPSLGMNDEDSKSNEEGEGELRTTSNAQRNSESHPEVENAPPAEDVSFGELVVDLKEEEKGDIEVKEKVLVTKESHTYSNSNNKKNKQNRKEREEYIESRTLLSGGSMGDPNTANSAKGVNNGNSVKGNGNNGNNEARTEPSSKIGTGVSRKKRAKNQRREKVREKNSYAHNNNSSEERKPIGELPLLSKSQYLKRIAAYNTEKQNITMNPHKQNATGNTKVLKMSKYALKSKSSTNPKHQGRESNQNEIEVRGKYNRKNQNKYEDFSDTKNKYEDFSDTKNKYEEYVEVQGHSTESENDINLPSLHTNSFERNWEPRSKRGIYTGRGKQESKSFDRGKSYYEQVTEIIGSVGARHKIELIEVEDEYMSDNDEEKSMEGRAVSNQKYKVEGFKNSPYNKYPTSTRLKGVLREGSKYNKYGGDPPAPPPPPPQWGQGPGRREYKHREHGGWQKVREVFGDTNTKASTLEDPPSRYREGSDGRRSGYSGGNSSHMDRKQKLGSNKGSESNNTTNISTNISTNITNKYNRRKESKRESQSNLKSHSQLPREKQSPMRIGSSNKYFMKPTYALKEDILKPPIRHKKETKTVEEYDDLGVNNDISEGKKLLHDIFSKLDRLSGLKKKATMKNIIQGGFTGPRRENRDNKDTSGRYSKLNYMVYPDTALYNY